MDEDSLNASIDTHKCQLRQVEQALLAAGDNDDLLTLKADLEEVISLTEDSLLSLKKSVLLDVTANTVTHTGGDAQPSSSAIDDEYAAFQAAIAEDSISEQNRDASTARIHHSDSSCSSDDSGADEDEACVDVPDLIGAKCRAPFSQDWGALDYHNALVLGIEPDCLKVRVVFCNPTHNAMLPCKYFMEGNCKFEEEDCRFSHGYLVNVSDLREFLDPDFSLLSIDGRCLVKYSDDIWHPARVIEIRDDHKYLIQYESYEETIEVDVQDILPIDSSLHNDSDQSCNEDEHDSQNQPLRREDLGSEDENDNEALPVFLWQPPKTFQSMGQWETHTRGIGSKLMTKMGYITGQGLGKNNDGRAEPVPIQLLPQGKSLDKIMELKAIAGDRNLYDVMKHAERKRRRQEEKLTKGYNQANNKTGVFDFINKKLGGKKGHVSDVVPKHHHNHDSSHKPGKKTQISESELKTRSDRHINMQLVKTHEEIKKAERELDKLRKQLTRNQSSGSAVITKLKTKITDTECYIQRLKTSETTMEQHKQQRTNHKKLTVF